MTGHSWSWKASFVAVRILGLYLVVHALILAGTSASILVEPAPGNLRWSMVIAILVLVAAGAELWLGADTIAARIARVANEEEFEGFDEQQDDVENQDDEDEVDEQLTETRRPTTLDARMTLTIGLTILGFFILIEAISAMIVEVGSVIQARSATSTNGFFVPQVRWGPYFFAFAAIALRAAFGAWLAFGSRAFTGFFHRIRYWPAEPPENDQ